jgi:hypothetical protein
MMVVKKNLTKEECQAIRLSKIEENGVSPYSWKILARKLCRGIFHLQGKGKVLKYM